MSDAAPIIVAALLGREDQAAFDRLRQAHFPPERNHLPAHLTMFHHLPPSVAEEVRHRLARETRDAPAPAARIAGVISLGRGVAYRIHSDGLDAIRTRLATAFSGLLTPQDDAAWRAHVTLQNKVHPDEARVLLQALQRDFRPRSVTIAGLAAYRYRGGPWELLSRHLFRS